MTVRLQFVLLGLISMVASAWGQSASGPFAIPKIKVRYTCQKTGRYWVAYGGSKDPADRHYCWDGTHYSRAEGGVPAFVLDYWSKSDRDRAHMRQEIENNTRDVRAFAAANRARSNDWRGPATNPGVELSQKPKAEPVDRALVEALPPGCDRAAVLKALGEPHGQIANQGDDGDEESLTWLLAGGGQARIRLKAGKVLNVKLP